MKLSRLPLACLLVASLPHSEAAPIFELRLTNGECLIGEIASADAASVTFVSATLGQVQIPQEQIASLQPKTAEGTPATVPAATAAPIAEGPSSAPRADSSSAANAEWSDTPVVGETMREEDIRQVFLRDSTILLGPGKFEVEANLSYWRQDTANLDTLLGNNLRRLHRRLAQMQLSLRYSPATRWEVFAAIPYIYGEQELVQLDGRSFSRQRAGFGDLSFGVKWQAVRESAQWPDVVLSLTATAPTGRNPYRADVADFGWGNGHWGLGLGVQLVRTYDPVVVFGGVEYTYYFPTDALGGNIEPGGRIAYNLGFGFALNDSLSLSTQFAGAVQTGGDSEVSGLRMESSESLVLRMAMTARLSPESYLEPAISWGLSEESPDYQLSLSYAQRF
jgi:hypothetical protein